MRSDDRSMARSGLDDKERQEAAPRAAAASEADRQEARQQDVAKRERPMTAAERRVEDEKRQFKKDNEKLEKTRQESHAMEAEVKGSDVKQWEVLAIDPNTQTFMYSNVSAGMLVEAQTERVARRVAMASTGNAEWEDESKTIVRERKPEGPRVLVADWKG